MTRDRTVNRPGKSQSNLAEKHILARRLREAKLCDSRHIELKPGTKRPRGSWIEEGTASGPDNVSGDYAIKNGHGLVVIDIDDYDPDVSLPDCVSNLPTTFTVETCHGGRHLYFQIDFDASTTNEVWGEVRADGSIVVGPGSTVWGIRNGKDCATGCCTPDKPGTYRILRDEPIAHLDESELEPLRTEPSPSRSTIQIPASTDPLQPDDELVTAAEDAIRSFYRDSRTTQRARQYLTDLLRGDYAERGFKRDRSKAEVTLAGLLHGIFVRHAEDHRTQTVQLAHAYISDSCNKHSTTDWGEKRKWITNGHRYQRHVLSTALSGFDDGTWERWQCKANQRRIHTDDYSEISYKTVHEAVIELSRHPPYPSKEDILRVCQRDDPSRAEKTHQTVLSRLRDERGAVKMAWLGGNDYVYYPSNKPDPLEARQIKINGVTEEQEPLVRTETI